MIQHVYRLIGHLTPQRHPPQNPRRIVLILPCCIGDVVLATAMLKALRRAYPDAHITWAVGGWSRQAIEDHPLLDAILDTGPAALPVKSPIGFGHFVRQLRAGKFDLAVSLVRSPLMSMALLFSGIPHRAGLESDGRGFGYTVRARINPNEARHEAEIYLDVARALGIHTEDCYANMPVSVNIREKVAQKGIIDDYIVINPAGGSNPGMAMDSKRWPAHHYAQLADKLAQVAPIVLLGGPQDGAIVNAVRAAMNHLPITFVGELSFAEIGGLAAGAKLYIGNDTGLTHLAAAVGAKTVMILGPSDPKRYAPFTPNSLAIWKSVTLNSGGVVGGGPEDWDWTQDGVNVDEVYQQIMAFERM